MSTEPNSEFLPSQRRSTTRPRLARLALMWLLLIIMFVSLYELFTSPSPARASGVESSLGPIVACSALGILFLLVALRVLSIQRQMRRAVIMNGEALELLGRGELQKAQARFAEIAEKFRRLRAVRVLAQYNGAVAHLLAGDLDRATAALVAIERDQGLAVSLILRANGASYLALCHALAGRLDQATPWLDEAEKLRPTASEPLRLTGMLTLGRAIVACRQGQPSEGARLIEADWHAFEAVGGDAARALRLVRAFAIAQAGGPRDDGAIDRLLAPLRESRPRSVHYLGAAWPEMAAFIQLHNV